MTTLVKLYRGGFNATRGLYSDYVVSAASVNRAINEAGTFDFSIPVGSLRVTPLDLLGVVTVGVLQFQDVFSADLYQDGELLIQGNVDSISVSYVDDEPNYKFSCNGELADFTRYIAKTTAYYQNEYLITIINDLLLTPITGLLLSKWALSEIFTLEDMLIKTTIDLRGESRLFGQLMKIVSAIPNTFLRYGGFAPDSFTVNRFTFDVGAFNRRVYPSVDAESLVQLTQTVKYAGVLRCIQSYGGEITLAGVTRRIDLQDAVAYDPNLASLILNVIAITSNGLENFNISKSYGEYTVKTYEEIVPAVKTDPSPTEIAQAGYALYLKTKADLLQQSNFQSNWSASVKALPADFKLGDQIFLRGQASQAFHDNQTQKTFYVDIGNIANWYRVNGYSLQIKDDNLTYSLDLATTLRLQGKLDPILDLYDSLKTSSVSEDAVYVSPGYIYSLLSATIPIDTETDAFGIDEEGNTYPAAQVLIPLDSPLPGGVTTVSLIRDLFSYDSNVTIRKITNPNYATNQGILAAVSVNRDWTTSDTTTIYALVRYTP